ncbi:hypothetical protein [Microbulbifer epialgicus]|uniref:C-type lectin domain-containing protein n=1 Tax=Microbulbifer epialgicus TaxID=393907 RepID=A0ABV4P107_9GAMM
MNKLFKKITFSTLLLTNIIVSLSVSAGEFTLDSNDWRIRALKIQNDIDLDVPLREGFRLGTHNSFNAAEYANAFRYVDPNQKLSLNDQLEAGVRRINFDVHEFFSFSTWKTELLLCHGTSNHWGCSSFDRRLIQGLNEVKSWLDKNPDQVIEIKIQDEMDGEHNEFITRVEESMGQLVYRPSGGCSKVPADLTDRDILNAGKQVYFTGNSACSDDNYQSLVFKNHEGGLSYDRNEVLNGVCPENPESGIMSVSEDRTNLSGGSDEKTTNASELLILMECGLNSTGLDMLGYTNSDRIAAAVWSWDVNEPNNAGSTSNEDCALSRASGRFNDLNCTHIKSFACENAEGDWYITSSQGVWSEGMTICHAETNGVYQFSVPTSPYKNAKLMQAKEAVSVDQVWLHYSDIAEEGKWEASHP